MISVVIPTISGREESLARAVDVYERTLKDEPHEIIVIKDAPTWPGGCNQGYAQAKGEVIHFSADDLEPLPGWHTGALRHLAHKDELPAPKIMDYRADGKFANEEDGGDGWKTHFTRIPIMTRLQAERIGPWPEIIYYADVWVSEKARALGIETRMVYSYAFIHHWCPIGRVDSQRNLVHSQRMMDELRKELV